MNIVKGAWGGSLAGSIAVLFAIPAPAFAKDSGEAGPVAASEEPHFPEERASEDARSGLPSREPVTKGSAGELSGSGLSMSAQVTLASEYRFRGFDLSGGDPALQGGLDIDHGSGLYAGAFASTLDGDTTGYGSLELDFYAGWSGYVGEGLVANAGIIAYTFPDAPAGDFDYYEIYGSLGFTLGPAEATLGAFWDPESRGLEIAGVRRDDLYVYGDLSAGIPGTPVRVKAHLGYTDGSVDFAGPSQSFDWSLGAQWSLRDAPLDLEIAYVDAAQDVAPGAFNPTDAGIVVSVTARF